MWRTYWHARVMPRWTCPSCDRSFGRRGQGHVCEPTEPLDDYLDRWSASDREIAERILDAMDDCGPVDVEAAKVGLFFSTTRKIVQLRPKSKRLELMVIVARRVDGDRVRRIIADGPRFAVFTDLFDPDDVDDWIHELLAEAYDLNPAEDELAQPPS
ncbi:MAG: DUF5655 domain-containing protein [Acidimicrobiales bacterium]|nr:DUF5655 domain-containing protein [Acidimicrobiales bacterium]